MGTNTSKKPNEKKKFGNENQSKPVISYTINNSNSQSELSERSPRPKNRHNKLQSPNNQRPIELSWLQQNNSHDNYKQTNQRDHHHNHHHHDHHHFHRTPLAINRWPIDDDNQLEKQKAKTFIEEYIHQ